MIRFLGFTLVAFLLPFAAYVLWRYGREGAVPGVAAWSPALILRLAGVGVALMLVAIAVILAAPTGEAGGVYRPAHIENGVIVPGRFE